MTKIVPEYTEKNDWKSKSIKHDTIREYRNQIEYEVDSGKVEDAKDTIANFRDLLLDKNKSPGMYKSEREDLLNKINTYEKQLGISNDANVLKRQLSNVGSELTKMVKDVETAREEATKPYDNLLSRLEVLEKIVYNTQENKQE